MPPTEACQDLKPQDTVMLTQREGVAEAQNLQVQGLSDYFNGSSLFVSSRLFRLSAALQPTLPWILLGRWSYFAWCEGMRHQMRSMIGGKDEGMVGEKCQHGISSFGISVVQVL